jgi:multidrug efflux pump
MVVGTLFTLFVVPVFYQMIAADHRARESAVTGTAPAPQPA